MVCCKKNKILDKIIHAPVIIMAIRPKMIIRLPRVPYEITKNLTGWSFPLKKLENVSKTKIYFALMNIILVISSEAREWLRGAQVIPSKNLNELKTPYLLNLDIYNNNIVNLPYFTIICKPRIILVDLFKLYLVMNRPTPEISQLIRNWSQKALEAEEKKRKKEDKKKQNQENKRIEKEEKKKIMVRIKIGSQLNSKYPHN
ncbi:hypothetical protein BpHYR1_008355 [Brachionus plicatilis]|uniref:Uncharacterized protein n=1 Tax=Brachionus plicatilis TaxID=10195 RepID=A0A3M7PZI0_BRAPC|nr:hypothetical protein BpHYR1_008355 [Brachionus plicatilis]